MFFDLMLRVGPAIQAVFELGYEPKEDLFYELTKEQYARIESEGMEVTCKWYAIFPENPADEHPELVVIDENEKKSLLDAAKYINNLCDNAEEKQDFSTFDKKLRWVASKLPPVFSQDTKYAPQSAPSHLKIVK